MSLGRTMSKPRKSLIGVLTAFLLLTAQMIAPTGASATSYIQVEFTKPCSELWLSATVGGSTTVRGEITYHGTDCGDNTVANYISDTVLRCDSAGANCSYVASFDFSGDLGSYDFWDYGDTLDNSYPGGYYKFCVTLRNNDLERYNNVCTPPIRAS